jgi:2-polyprenyl-6-methoxyphenol hydroxylase-like FAD-dependent oxidoreductase
MSSMMVDCLIVGGGIGGAVLANLLTRGGRRVLVLEKNLVPVPITRPEILWPHTVAFLQTLLPADQEIRWLLPLRDIHILEEGHQVARIIGNAVERSRIQPNSTAAHETRRLLLESAGCEVVRGMEVRGLLKEGNRVVGVRAHCVTDGSEREWRAPWTVGDDGPGSLVRRECGIPLAPQRANADMLSFGTSWPPELPDATVHLWLNPRRVATGIIACGVIPQPGGRGAGIVLLRPRAFADEGVLRGTLAEFAHSDPRLAQVLGSRVFPKDFVHFQLQFGNAPHYTFPGAALVGDAAHPVTPAGGQGANLAIADARALAASLLGSSDPQLTQYQFLRRRAANRSLRFSRGAALAFSLPDWLLGSALPTAVRLAFRWPSLPALGLRQVGTAFQ